MTPMGRAARVAVAVAQLAACAPRPELVVPSAEEAAAYYTSENALEVHINGNVVVLTVRQSAAELRRGGSLWAKVGPYIYLFSDETRRLFEDFSGLAAVRVITRTVGGEEIANAILARDELTGVLWRRALNIAGQARLEGTERPGLLDVLVRWGEDHTTYTYNPRFVPR
jgi:hypothetical protein